jgi:Tfp pilus assembly protein PilX
MIRRLRDEDGMAMITAVLVSGVVLLLSVSAINLAVHNTNASGYDRRRLAALNAAEAGIDYYYSQLNVTASASLPCDVTRTLTTSPAGTFTVTPTFYYTQTGTLSCPSGSTLGSSAPTPIGVLLHSVGTPSGLTSPSRTMESYVKLSVSQSGAWPAGALYGYSAVNLNSNTQIFGNGASNGDVYSSGSMSVASNSTIYGNLYVQGTVTLASNSDVKQDLWASGNITMNGNSKVRGSATSSGGGITLNNTSHLYGNASAAGAITKAGGAKIDGYSTPNASGLSAPPSKTYPTFTFVQSDWTAAGYPPAQTFTGSTACTSAQTAITSWTSGNLLLRLNALSSPPCTLNPPTKTLPGNVAIVTDGPVTFLKNTKWSAGAGSPFMVNFFVGLAGVAGSCDFSTQANSGIGAQLDALLYVPSTCALNLASNSSITSGQMYGGTINLNSNLSFAYKQITIPGQTPTGFNEEVLYLREVK